MKGFWSGVIAGVLGLLGLSKFAQRSYKMGWADRGSGGAPKW